MKLDTTSQNTEPVSVLFADVFGYSVLMEKAEQEVCTITNHCINLFVKTSKVFGGKVREIAGDGLMIQFTSADDALEFAVAVRRKLDKEDTALSIGESILFRIGIHTGPVIKVPRGIRGHTINVAARIEAEVPPERVGISETTLENLTDREPYEFHDQGYRTLKNIQAPIRLYLVEYGDAPSSTNKTHDLPTTSALEQAPALVIAPFQDLGETKALKPLQRAVAEEMLFHFSKRREFRLHTGDFLSGEHRQTNIATRLCRMFAITYLLEGSMSQTAEGIRLSTRLIFTQTGQIVDSSQITIRQDTQSEDLLTASITLSLRTSHQVENFELRQITASMNEGRYGKYLLARKLNHQLSESTNREALHILEDLRSDGEPDADILVELAHAQHMAWRYGWSEKSELMLEAAIASARSAIREDPEHARAHNELGYALLFTNEYEASFESFRRAQDLSPNDPWIMADVATAKVFTGDSARAVSLLTRSLSLNSTVDLDWRLWSLAEAHFPLRNYEAVVATIHRMHDPTEGQRLAAASYAMLDQTEKAQRLAEKILERQPDFSIEKWSEMQPDTDESELEHYATGLAKAGLPK